MSDSEVHTLDTYTTMDMNIFGTGSLALIISAEVS